MLIATPLLGFTLHDTIFFANLSEILSSSLYVKRSFVPMIASRSPYFLQLSLQPSNIVLLTKVPLQFWLSSILITVLDSTKFVESFIAICSSDISDKSFRYSLNISSIKLSGNTESTTSHDKWSFPF